MPLMYRIRLDVHGALPKGGFDRLRDSLLAAFQSLGVDPGDVGITLEGATGTVSVVGFSERRPSPDAIRRQCEIWNASVPVGGRVLYQPRLGTERKGRTQGAAFFKNDRAEIYFLPEDSELTSGRVPLEDLVYLKDSGERWGFVDGEWSRL